MWQVGNSRRLRFFKASAGRPVAVRLDGEALLGRDEHFSLAGWDLSIRGKCTTA